MRWQQHDNVERVEPAGTKRGVPARDRIMVRSIVLLGILVALALAIAYLSERGTQTFGAALLFESLAAFLLGGLIIWMRAPQFFAALGVYVAETVVGELTDGAYRRWSVLGIALPLVIGGAIGMLIGAVAAIAG